MTWYVESNFVLELALDQEQAESAEAILAAAEQTRIELAVPVAALVEPASTVVQRGRTREKAAREVTQQVRDLGRSRHRSREIDALTSVVSLLRGIEEQETRRISECLVRLMRIARVLGLDDQVLVDAETFRVELGLTLVDAQILACVLADLSRNIAPGPHWLVSRNWKDLGDRRVVALLAERRCRFAGSFGDAATNLPLAPAP